MTTMPFDKLRLREQGFKNPRTRTGLSPESIRELAINIGLNNLLNPPIVRPDGLVLAGQRRYRAIEFLLQWFSHHPPQPRAQGDDHPIFHEFFGDLTHADISTIEVTVREFEEEGIPVRIRQLDGNTPGGAAGIALADNVQREDLSTFEESAYLASLVSDGLTQADIVKLVGKSKTWVSRRITTYQKACPELLALWESGEVSFERAQEIVQHPLPEQPRLLAGPVPRGIRGPANRPGIDTVKEILGELEKTTPKFSATDERSWHWRGVVDALRWVAGEKTSAEFGDLVGGGSDAHH